MGHGTDRDTGAAAGVAVGHSAPKFARYHVVAVGTGINDDITVAVRRVLMFRLSFPYDDWLLAQYAAVQPG